MVKQYAEEKFMATNLSSTNIRNENTKSKASREFRELHSNTPIRFGNMESNDMSHMGSGYVVVNLLIHSLSPHARRLTEEMFTGDPFHIDIKLDGESTNRSAEIANVYLKVMGRRLIFTKRKKVRHKIVISPISSVKPFVTSPIFYNKEPGFDWNKDWNDRLALEEKKKRDPNVIHPIIYQGQDTRRLEKQYKEEQDYDYFKWQQQVLRDKVKEMSEDN